MTEEEQFIHPYYDDISAITWLECRLTVTDQALTAEFFVNRDAENITPGLYNRMGLGQFRKQD